METHIPPCLVQSCRRQLWYQIHWRREPPTLIRCPPAKNVRNRRRSRRQHILQHQPTLELQERVCRRIHADLRAKTIDPLCAPEADETPTLPISPPTQSRMGKTIKQRHLTTIVRCSTMPAKNASNKLSAVSCTMTGPSIRPF